MKTIGVLTSGGDSPGMNAAVRAVVRTALYNNIKVCGIYEGYNGLITNQVEELNHKDVAHIIQRGGTILRSARCKEFLNKEGRTKAFETIQKHNIDALITIGGDGTFRGALALQSEFNLPVIGIPGTIDNDLYGTTTLGFDTAINTVVQSVDKIRDTATSHNRLFIVEVMGRDAGFIALHGGIACGAEDILIPETPTYIDTLVEKLKKGRRSNKRSGIILVAEGDEFGGAYKVAEAIEKATTAYEIRVSVLGHMQRGGSPSAKDRILGSSLGYNAVKALLAGKKGIMVGELNGKLSEITLEKATKHHQAINQEMLTLAQTLGL